MLTRRGGTFFVRERQIDATIGRLGRQRAVGCYRRLWFRQVCASAGRIARNTRDPFACRCRSGLALCGHAAPRPSDSRAGDRSYPGARGDKTAEGIALRRPALQRAPYSLIEEMRDRSLTEHSHLLLLVHRFEELFWYERLADRGQAEAFVALLLASAKQREVPI
jgi:hypothetical protein